MTKKEMSDSVSSEIFAWPENTSISPRNLISPRNFGSLDVDRLTAAEPAPRIDTVEELISFFMEHQLFRFVNAFSHEIFIDALLRLNHPRTERENIFVKPVLKYYEEILPGLTLFNHPGLTLSCTLWCAFAVWLSDEVTMNSSGEMKIRVGSSFLTLEPPYDDIPEFYGQRQLWDNLRLLTRKKPHIPLATPTHNGGWLDPLVLVERILTDPDQLANHPIGDKAMSLYRLPRDHRRSALDRLGNALSDDPYVNTLRKILEASDEVDESAPLIFRCAYQTDIALRHHLPLFRFDEKIVLTTNGISKCVESDQMQILMNLVNGLEGPDSLLSIPDKTFFSPPHFYRHWGEEFPWANEVEQNNRGTKRTEANIAIIYRMLSRIQSVHCFLPVIRLLCPAISAPYYWLSLSQYGIYNDSTLYIGMEDALLPLLDSNEPIPQAAVCLIVLLLTAKPPDVSTLAQDVLLQAVNDGRLDSTKLASALVFWIRHDLPRRNRWLKTFTIVAGESLTVADVICQTLQAVVPSLEIRELSGFLALLLELCSQLGNKVEDQTCREFLASLKGSNKATQYAKILLAH